MYEGTILGIKCTERSNGHFMPTTLERQWDMNEKLNLTFLLTYSITVYTVFYHSYCVEASNPLTSFADFRFKDRFLRKIVWRNSHF